MRYDELAESRFSKSSRIYGLTKPRALRASFERYFAPWIDPRQVFVPQVHSKA